MESDRVFAGAAFSGGTRGCTLVFLSGNGQAEMMHGLSVPALTERIAGMPTLTIAVGGPLHVCALSGDPGDLEAGAVFRRTRLERARAAEAELIRRGIPVRLTPAVEGAAPGWMRAALQFGRWASGMGFVEGPDGHDAARWILETNPQGCYSVWLGRLPFGRDTLEGRLQRQLALIRERVNLPDPMDALEEVTAHHLLAGRLTLDRIGRPDALDALAAALTAFRAWKTPAEVSWLGRDANGRICLPARELADTYRIR
jgi:hypothetical protein